MKPIVYILICCFILSGCTTPQSSPSLEDNTVESIYYFYTDNRTLYKYNLLSGATSPVCTDPLCVHDRNCFFSEVNYVCAHENTIFFSKSDTRTITTENGLTYITESICSFDYNTGQSTELCTLKSGSDSSLQGMLEFHDGYIYFYRQTPDPETIEFSLYRVPSSGGTPEDMELSVPMWHGAHYNNRIFFFDNVNTMYSTDIYGNNRTDEVVLKSPGRIILTRDTSNGYLYYSILYSGSHEIWRKDLTTQNHELLYTTESGIIASLYPTDSAIYFLISEKEIQYGQTADGRSIRDPYGGKVYKLDLEFKKCEIVYNDVNTHITYLRKSQNNIIVFHDEISDNTIVSNRFTLNN